MPAKNSAKHFLDDLVTFITDLTYLLPETLQPVEAVFNINPAASPFDFRPRQKIANGRRLGCGASIGHWAFRVLSLHALKLEPVGVKWAHGTP